MAAPWSAPLGTAPVRRGSGLDPMHFRVRPYRRTWSAGMRTRRASPLPGLGRGRSSGRRAPYVRGETTWPCRMGVAAGAIGANEAEERAPRHLRRRWSAPTYRQEPRRHPRLRAILEQTSCPATPVDIGSDRFRASSRIARTAPRFRVRCASKRTFSPRPDQAVENGPTQLPRMPALKVERTRLFELPYARFPPVPDICWAVRPASRAALCVPGS
jgi:hypothetical protein